MPSFDNNVSEIAQVAAFSKALSDALDYAREIKPLPSIEPALTKSDFDHLYSQLPIIFPSATSPGKTQAADGAGVGRTRQYSYIETAVRDRFETLLSSTSIDSPDFVAIWNILDLVAALADSEECEPTNLFQLVEELIDSQTIEGCRKTFDYLESRRERITAKHWEKKGLTVLRTCNELLRRLSRAEDISFSGRVFIFMFQSFPMGDKGTVNLRGTYHVENVTTYEDVVATKPEDSTEQMDVDVKEDLETKSVTASAGAKAVSFDAKEKPASDKPLDTNALYPVFWSLQQYFSQPTRLFDSDDLAKFKSGLEATVTAFESVAQGTRNSKTADDVRDASKKRKRIELDASESGNFNPKYLTSRDLFELEISDLFFRRHILIQAIIVLDFLRSMTAAAKAKHAQVRHVNKSVMYSDNIVSEEDDKWAENIRNRIYTYIFEGPDGQYVHRIIQAVTQRDKGWTRWKIETCPPIERPAVTPAEFNEARSSAKRMATNKKLRPHPMGSLNLDFLKGQNGETAMDEFKDPSRWKLPDLATFKDKIAADDLELDFAKDEKEKGQMIEAKASKTWRALRIASRTRLAAFDKIEDWSNINAVFEDPGAAIQETGQEAEDGTAGRKPELTKPIFIAGPKGSGKTSLIALLRDRQPHVFEKLLQHTTRPPQAGEVNGQDFHFVDSKQFNALMDNDQFFENHEIDGVSYGTSAKMAESITESGKIPIMECDQESIQSVKEWEYPARCVYVSPPSGEKLQARLKDHIKYTEDDIAEILKTQQDEVEKCKSSDLFDITIENDDLEQAYRDLETFVYGGSTQTNGTNGHSDPTSEGDATMTNVTTIEEHQEAASDTT